MAKFNLVRFLHRGGFLPITRRIAIFVGAIQRLAPASLLSVALLTLSSFSAAAFQATKPATLWGTGAMASCASAIAGLPSGSPFNNPRCTDESDGIDNAAKLWTDTYQPPFALGTYFGGNCPAGYWSNGRVCNRTATQPVIDTQKNLGVPVSCAAVGNPIFVGTGNKILVEVDYQGAGVYPLSFTRFYSSQAADSGSLGANWRSNYDRTLTISTSEPDKVWTRRPDGKTLYFNLVSGVWKADADVIATLVRTADGWRLTMGDADEVESYSVAGKLLAIQNRTGLAKTLAYDASGRLIQVTDPFGRRLAFEYDLSGRIRTIIDPAGNTFGYAYGAGTNNLISVSYPSGGAPIIRTYLYNEPAYTAGAYLPHALTGIVDENQTRYASYQYESSGRAVVSQHAGGAEQVTVVYATNGNGDVTATTVTDAAGATRTYGLGTVLGVVKNTTLSQPAGAGCGPAASALSYDANGNIASRSDFNGNVVTYGYDLTRNLEISRTEAAGTALVRTISTQWHPVYRLPVQINEPGRTTTFSYDGAGNLLQQAVTDAATNVARVWTYTYNGAGQVLSVDGPRSDVSDITNYTYDSASNVIRIANAVGHETHISSYDAHGRPLSIADSNGRITILAYDARGRLTSRNSGGEMTSYTYDPAGQLIRVTLPTGARLDYAYDAAHRLTQIQDSLGNKIAYTLDAMGNRIKEDIYGPANTLTKTHARVFDALSRLQKDIGGANPGADVTQYAYDGNGNLLRATDALNYVTTQSYDALNRLIQAINPNAGATQYGHTALDQLAAVADPRNLTTAYTRNAFGDITQTQSPDAGVSQTAYDAAGNVVSRTDAKNQTTLYQYDALNRLMRETRADGSFVTFTYDAGVNGKGRLTGMTDPSGATSWSYDPHGRIIGKQQQTIDLPMRALQYAYNAQGQLTNLTYPSGNVVGYVYNGNGQIASVTLNGNPLLSAIAYQPFGPVKTWIFANGQSVNRSFDLDGRMTANSLGSLSYDAAGRIASAYGKTYGYDALDRLTSFSDGVTPLLTYQYDANGNRTRQTAGSVVNDYAIAAASNRLQSITGGATTLNYAHDANGSVTSDGRAGISLQYDAAGRLSVFKGCVQFAYNGVGERVKKFSTAPTCAAGGPPRQPWKLGFVYDESGKLIGEYPGIGNVQETVYLGDIPVAVLQANGVYYIHADHLNTPRKIYNAAGQLAWHWEIATFGASSPNQYPSPGVGLAYNLRFPGQYFDFETGYFYNYFRDYDPKTGRYVQSDPIGLAGGINPYVYVQGNPIGFIDPIGLDTAVVYGAATSSNPFGHVAIAMTGQGVYSFGTGNDPGSSLTSYLASQAKYRNSILYIIKTSPEQEKTMLNYLNSLNPRLPSVPSADSNDTCAVRTNEALRRAGFYDPRDPISSQIFGNSSPFPIDSAVTAKAYSSEILRIPKGTTVFPISFDAFNP